MKIRKILGVIGALVISFGIIGCSSQTENVGGIKPASSKTFNKKDAIEVDYKELKKDIQKHNGEFVSYTGKVEQVQVDGGDAIIRLAVGEAFDFDSIMWINTKKGIVTDIVDGDYVTVYGELTGSHTYTSQANFEITLPSMSGEIIEKTTLEQINEKEGSIIFEMFDAVQWEQTSDTKWSKKWEGVITNHTDNDYSYINGTIKFIDSEGITVDTQNVYMMDGLRAGESMHIDFTYFGDKVFDKWEIDSVEWRKK